MSFSRREFLAAMMAGGAVIAGDLWIPGQKLISIPSGKIFIADGTLAWMEGDARWVYQDGAARAINMKFDFEIVGAEIRNGVWRAA